MFPAEFVNAMTMQIKKITVSVFEKAVVDEYDCGRYPIRYKVFNI